MSGERRRFSMYRELYWKEVERCMTLAQKWLMDAAGSEAKFRTRHEIPEHAWKFEDHEANVVFEWEEPKTVCCVVGSPALVAGRGRAAVAGLPTFLASVGTSPVEPLTPEEAEWLNLWPHGNTLFSPRRYLGPCVFQVTPGDVLQRFEVQDG